MKTTTTSPRWAPRRLPALLAVMLGALAMTACGAPEECSSDDDCQDGYKCFRSRSGWVQSSVCAPADPVADMSGPDATDTMQPDIPAGCGVFACNPPVPGAQCEADRTTVCNLSCESGVNADCDGDMQNGCEVSLLTDAANCGTCGRTCAGELAEQHTSGVCMVASCVATACLEHWYDLDDDPANGCPIGVDPATLQKKDTVGGQITAVERLPMATFVAFGTHVGFFSEGNASLTESSGWNTSQADVVSLRATSSGATEHAVAVLDDGSVHAFVYTGTLMISEVDDGTGAVERVADVGQLDPGDSELEIVIADRERVDCVGCGAERAITGASGPVVARVIDVDAPADVDAVFVSAHGPATAPPRNIITAEHVVGGANLILRTGSLPNLSQQPELIEPWLDEGGATLGMVILNADDTLDLWTYSEDGSNLIRARAATGIDAGTDVHDVVSLGGDRFLTVHADGFTILSIDEDDEPARLDFSIPMLDPDVLPGSHGPASWTAGDSTLSLAYGQRLYVLPITFDEP